jgi:hypothetical protein
LGIFSKNYRTFYQKIVIKLSKIWDWDTGSEIRDQEKPILDPGSRVQKGTGSRIQIHNTDTHTCHYHNLGLTETSVAEPVPF